MRHLRFGLRGIVCLVVAAVACPAAAGDGAAAQHLLPIVRMMPPEAAPAPGTPTPPASVPADGPEVSSAPHLHVNSCEVRAPLDAAACDGVQPGRDQAVVLYVSGNSGRSWVRTQKRTLPTAALEFRAVTDGVYWAVFRGEPVASRGADPLPGTRPDLLITVDTAPPVVVGLTASPARENEPIRVAWRVTDAAGTLAAVKLAAAQGQSQETLAPRDVAPSLEGSAQVGPLSAGVWDFTVTFVDPAGNMTTASCRATVEAVAAAEVVAEPPMVSVPAPDHQGQDAPDTHGQDARATGQDDPAAGTQRPREDRSTDVAPMHPTGDSPATAPTPATEPASQLAVAPARGDQWVEPAGEVRAAEGVPVLRSRMLSIGYTWDEERPPDRVGLWVTTDGGRAWQLDHVAERLTGTFVFQAAADGVYGFHTHREAGRATWGVPLSGEAPQLEIVVDTEPPRVRWTSPLGAETSDGLGRTPAKVAATVALAWTATDANLGDRPVRLDYRRFGQTLWQPIAAELPGSGSYEWTMPDTIDGAVEVRVTALDRAGHLASADLSLEVVRPAVGIEPSPDAATPATDQASGDAVAESQRAYAMATLARLQENWGDAERQLLRATTLNPQHARAWVDLGGIYAAGRRWDPAVDAYRKAASLQPQSTNALLGLSRSLAARGDMDGALRAVETLLGLAPADGDALVLYGDLLWRSGRHDEARQAWLKALDSGGGHQGRLAAIQKRLQLKP